MRFPEAARLQLPCTFAGLVPGRQHTDGRRYLPLLLFRLQHSDQLLGVVDRHHRADPALVGTTGLARLVFLLGRVVRSAAATPMLMPEPGLAAGQPSLMPALIGQVLAVPSWRLERTPLPYETLNLEVLLDLGVGTVGVRTSMTAPQIGPAFGGEALLPGDWLHVSHSRIDLLEFARVG